MYRRFDKERFAIYCTLFIQAAWLIRASCSKNPEMFWPCIWDQESSLVYLTRHQRETHRHPVIIVCRDLGKFSFSGGVIRM